MFKICVLTGGICVLYKTCLNVGVLTGSTCVLYKTCLTACVPYIVLCLFYTPGAAVKDPPSEQVGAEHVN